MLPQPLRLVQGAVFLIRFLALTILFAYAYDVTPDGAWFISWRGLFFRAPVNTKLFLTLSIS